jgi:hypothetical protein
MGAEGRGWQASEQDCCCQDAAPRPCTVSIDWRCRGFGCAGAEAEAEADCEGARASCADNAAETTARVEAARRLATEPCAALHRT